MIALQREERRPPPTYLKNTAGRIRPGKTGAHKFPSGSGFLDEDDRSALPAEDGGILAYIGILSLEGRVSSQSLPQYISAVSRYHVLHHMTSPTTTQLVRALVKAYDRTDEKSNERVQSRIGILCQVVSASLVRRMVVFGFETTEAE